MAKQRGLEIVRELQRRDFWCEIEAPGLDSLMSESSAASV